MENFVIARAQNARYLSITTELLTVYGRICNKKSSFENEIMQITVQI